MQITCSENTTYILLNGIRPPRNIKLCDNIELQPADCSHLKLDVALSLCPLPDDIPVIAGFTDIISAQFAISANSPEELAMIAWNSSWYAFLLSAFFRTEVGFNLESSVPANEISTDTNLRTTNHRMYGLNRPSPYKLTDQDMQWLSTNFGNAFHLLENENYRTAIQCLAIFRWHTTEKLKLALLWEGIETVFGVSSENRLKFSIYIARFLHPDDTDARCNVFAIVKNIYSSRSADVHGSDIKGATNKAVDEAASILCALLKRCTSLNKMPNVNEFRKNAAKPS